MNNVKAFLACADVQANLEALGVDPDKAEERVAALSPEELADLSNKIDEVPAGGLLEVLGVVLIVLIDDLKRRIQSTDPAFTCATE